MEKTDILLINPFQDALNKAFRPLFGCSHPLSLAYIAANIRKHGLTAEILDANVLRLSIEEIDSIVKKKDPLFIGISLYTFSIKNAFAMAAGLRRLNPGIKIIAGGPHATLYPAEVLNRGGFDFVVKGEGEETLKELLTALKRGDDLNEIKGIVFLKGGEIITTAERGGIENVDAIPLPAYDLLPMEKYRLTAWRSFSRGAVGSVLSARGCPYKCYFCYRSLGDKLRLRSPENIIEEILLLKNKFGIKEFMFVDDVFTADVEHAIAVCRLIGRHKIGLPWSCNSRVDRPDKRLFKEMSLAGCKGIFFGVETGSQEILDQVNKGVRLSQIRQTIELCRQNRIISFCNFMAGLPGETRGTLKKTAEFIREIRPDFLNFSIFIPGPGSKLFEELIGNDPGIDWDNYKENSFGYWGKNKEYAERRLLDSWIRKTLLIFYFNPRRIISIIRMTLVSGNFPRIFKSIILFINYQFSKKQNV